MQTLKLTLEYDGTNYHGWQRQANAVTIQETFETALQKIVHEPVSTVAAGRTDTGVHAFGQVVSFQTRSTIEPTNLRRGLNSLLPGDIAVIGAEEVPAGFDARRRALGKHYRYRILNRECPSGLYANRAWHMAVKLDLEPMWSASRKIIGEHDFSSFRAADDDARSPVRKIERIEIERRDNDLLDIEFVGMSFLRHMVRNIVGTLVDVGREKTSMEEFEDILEARDRRRAGITAPAQGLYLVSVRYG